MKKILALILTFALVLSVTVFSHAAQLLGDVDRNNTVNSTDALIVLQYAIGDCKNIDTSVADVNHDGKINSSDALVILEISTGKVDEIASYVVKMAASNLASSTTSKTTTKAAATTKKTTTTTKATTKATTTTTTTKATTKATTTTTKATTKATTKKTTTAAAKTYSCPYEVTPGTSVKLPSGLNAAHKRSWLVTKFSGLDIRISRLEYGSKITQRFDSKLNSQIVNPKTLTYTPACTIAVITCDSPTRLNMSKGTSQTSTEADAKSVDAVIAIPGNKLSYWQDCAATIRSGTLYKKFTGSKACAPQLVIYKNGKWEFRALDNAGAQEAIKNGAYNSFNIQDIIIKDGKYTSNWKDTTYRNHTFLGQISENKYVFMSTEFMPIKSAGEIMLKYGVKTAVMICGGNCTTMYLKGVGNSTNSTGASIKGLNKLGYFETEWFAKNGLLEAKKGGGPCTDEMDCIYFK